MSRAAFQAGPSYPAVGFLVTEWKRPPNPRGTLVGFATLRFDFGLVIKNVAMHRCGENAWANLPSVPRLDEHGTVELDYETGRPRFIRTLSWPNREIAVRFNEVLVAAIEAEDPGALAP